jgi:hypothetical protein
MNYYHLQCSFNQGEAYIEREKASDNLSLDLTQGKPLQFKAGDLVLYHSRQNKQLTDLLGGTYFVVTERMKNVLEILEPQHLEFFAVMVQTTWDKQKHPYYLVNVLETVDGIDLEQSEYDAYGDGLPGIDSMKKLVLNTERIGTRQVFMLEGLYREYFVSQTVKQALQEAKYTGIEFTPSHEFKYGTAAAGIQKTYQIDCSNIHSETEFWQRYLEITNPNDSRLFACNIEAFEAALKSQNAPGYPGQCVIRFINSSQMKTWANPYLFERLEALAHPDFLFLRAELRLE